MGVVALITAAVPAFIILGHPDKLLRQHSLEWSRRTLAQEIGRRGLAARLDLGVPYSPRRTTPSRSSHLDILIADLERLSNAAESADTWNVTGVAHLIRGRLDRAIWCFERALVISSRNKGALTNLSVALTARGRPGDSVRALDAAYAAIEGSGTPEGYFNAAVAAERAAPMEEVQFAWHRALIREPDPTWRNTIAHRLIMAQLSSRNGSRDLRASLDRELIPNWIIACLNRSSEERVRAGRVVAAIEKFAAHSNDRYFADVAAWLGVGACRPDRATTYAAFLAARQLYERDQRDAALQSLEALLPTLARQGSPATPLAQWYVATCLYFTPRQIGSSALLMTVIASARERRHYEVMARSEWMRGYIAEDRNAFDEALSAYAAAVAAYESAGYPEGVISTFALIGSVHDTLGDYARGWRHREDALARLKSMVAGRWSHGTLSLATRAAARDGLHRAAYRYALIGLEAARRDDAPIRIAEAAIEYARAAFQTGRRSSAQQALREAAATLERIDSNGARRRVRAGLAMVQALFEDPEQALNRLSEALEAYSSVGSDLLRGRLLLQRGRLHLAHGDENGAAHDFRAGIETFERARSVLTDTATRLSYFEEAWQLFDELVALTIRRGDYEAGLAILEQGRGRAVRELTRSPASPRSLSRILPPRSAVVTFAVLDHALVLWLLRDGGFRAIATPTERTTLQAVTAAIRTEHIGGPAASRLYDMLIRPIEGSLVGVDRLYVVPDPLLHHVPFAALWRAASREFLVDRHTLVLLPSLAGAQVGSGRTTTMSHDRALIIAAENGGLGEGLPRLVGAVREAQAIASLYPAAWVLTSDQLRKSEVLSAVPRYPIVHFAGHAVINPEAPQFSRLLLSSDAREGALFAHELERVDMHHVDTIVLAACDTATGRTYRSEGVMSLARSFVARGAQNVIAALWSLDDTGSVHAFREIHGLMRRGHSPADALAAVQRVMFREDSAAAVRPLVVVSRTIW